MGELLHATPLRPGEYVWGKFAGTLVLCLVALAVQLALVALFLHVVPSEAARALRGPFALGNYVRPALVFVVPFLVFVAGAAFTAGAWSRRPAVVFFVPTAVLLFCLFYVFRRSGAGGGGDALRYLDPTGYRWLRDTFLNVDRGVAFYNARAIPIDAAFALSRLAWATVGLLGVAATHVHLTRTLRHAQTARAKHQLSSVVAAPLLRVAAPPAVAPLASLQMRQRRPGFWASVCDIARAELRELRTQPGLYLFVPLILLLTLIQAFEAEGPFHTRLLLTPGQLASRQMDVLNGCVSILLLCYLVESLERDRTTRLAFFGNALPVSTLAQLAGKIAAVLGISLVVLLAALAASLLALLIQSADTRVSWSLVPFALLWGALLGPTFLMWTTLIAAVHAATNNRYTTYAIGVFVLLMHSTLFEGMSWAENVFLLGGANWSDLAPLEQDRPALVLNRLLALALAGFYLALATRLSPRRERDVIGVWGRLRPLPLFKTGLLVLVCALPALVLSGALSRRVARGFEGAAAVEQQKNYWKRNFATWNEADLPDLREVRLAVDLRPAARAFSVKGTYTLVNPHKTPLRRIALTGGLGWTKRHWTLDGKKITPDDRSGLFVFTPGRPLALGRSAVIGFSYDAPDPGISRRGGPQTEFVLPSAVVLSSFNSDFVPTVGYDANIGVDETNQLEPREFDDDFYRRTLLRPLFGGSATPFALRLVVTAPAGYTVNGVGRVVSDQTKNRRRTVVWQTDRPVRDFNLVGGKNLRVRRGKGVAVYYFPAHNQNVSEMTRALEAARRWYGAWFAPYPYATLKLTEFPDLAGYAQGFASNISFGEGMGFLTNNRDEDTPGAAFFVTAHEAAHQWWGNLVTPGNAPGGNVLSEGMAHYSAALLLEKVKGADARRAFLKQAEERYNEERSVDSEEPLVRLQGGKQGDQSVTYDKGGWVFWMLEDLMGEAPMRAGLRAFIRKYQGSADHPVLQDLLATLRPLAPNKKRFDDFADQWFDRVVLPEYTLAGAQKTRRGKNWRVSVRVSNAGSGTFPVTLAAFGAGADEARTTVTLAPGAAKTVTLSCSFQPDRVVVDPDVVQLMRGRNAAWTWLK